ncbi:MAG: ArsR/SmtB family transcription factor [Gammaproteobacteria bacterium]
MALSAISTSNTPSQDEAEELTALCKALADALRLEILRLLRISSFGVLEISQILQIRQSALSHHLKILATAGLASTRREGNSIFYRRRLLTADDPHHGFKKSAFEAIDKIPLSAELIGRLNVVQQERSEQSLQFFTRHADKFREKQGLVAEHAQYMSSLLDLMRSLDLNAQHRVMEVGPGQGELLAELAHRFDNVIAVDNALEMLNLAKQTVANEGLTNVAFIHGDTHKALEQQAHCDLVLFDMVLHHLPSPHEAFQHAHSLLNDNGLLLIVDLCPHDQDWVKESCGDIWLGFDLDEMNDWAEQAGLEPAQTVFLGLRNGFQIQMCVFKKIKQDSF